VNFIDNDKEISVRVCSKRCGIIYKLSKILDKSDDGDEIDDALLFIQWELNKSPIEEIKHQ